MLRKYFKLLILLVYLNVTISTSPIKISNAQMAKNEIKPKLKEATIVERSVIAKNVNKNFYLIENDLEFLPVENVVTRKKTNLTTTTNY